MTQQLAQQLAAQATAIDGDKTRPDDVTAIAYFPTEDELEIKAKKFSTKQAVYGGIILLIVVCAAGHYILKIKNELEIQKWERLTRLTLLGVQSTSYLVAQVAAQANGASCIVPPLGHEMAANA